MLNNHETNMTQGTNVIPMGKANSEVMNTIKAQIDYVFDGWDASQPLDAQKLEEIFSPQEREHLSAADIIRAQIYVRQKTGLSKSTIEKAFNTFFNRPTPQKSIVRTPVVWEENGYTFIDHGNGPKQLANFTLNPCYQVIRRIKTNSGHELVSPYYFVEMIVINEQNQIPERHIVRLHTTDFDTKEAFQKATEYAGSRLLFTKHSVDIAYLGKHLFNKPWSCIKESVSDLGIYFKQGKKYFITPDAVYDVNSREVEPSLTFISNTESDMVGKYKIGNINYDRTVWQESVAPTFLKNVVHIHQKQTMLPLLGWLASLPNEYVFRKKSGDLGGFPHAMIAGVHGGGKSMLVEVLLPYLGYKNDTEMLNIGTATANLQSVGWSRTIPVIYDEYRPDDWSEQKKKDVHTFLRESYGRSSQRKSNSNYNEHVFPYKNPLLLLGQSTLEDDALLERIIQVYLDSNFMNLDTPEALKAKKHSQELRHYENKNFWAGYCIWASRFSDEQVLRVYRIFKKYVVQHFPKVKDRLRSIYAVAMTGLFFFRYLAKQLGIKSEELGYGSQDIWQLPHIIRDNSLTLQGSSQDDLERFLNDISSYGVTYENSKASLFGARKNIGVYNIGQSSKSKHEWGKENKPAHIGNRQKVIIIKVDDVLLNEINRQLGTNYKKKLLEPILMAHYDKMGLTGEGFVLAPNGYRVNQVRYAVFDYDVLMNEFGFQGIKYLIE